jgi:hypothetical protein
MKKAEFWIAAYCEEETLPDILDKILSLEISGVEKKIFIATAADASVQDKSRQHTHDIAEAYKKDHNCIDHLPYHTQGKQEALNSMCMNSDNPDVVFIMDADIFVPSSNTFERLYNDIIEEGFDLSSALTLTADEKRKFPFDVLAKTYNKALPYVYSHFQFPNGRLFSVSQNIIENMKNDNPRRLLLDDNLIDDMVFKAYAPNIKMNKEALAYMHYFNSWEDYINYRRAYTFGYLYMNEKHGNEKAEKSKLKQKLATTEEIPFTIPERFVLFIEERIRGAVRQKAVFDYNSGIREYAQQKMRYTTKGAFHL